MKKAAAVLLCAVMLTGCKGAKDDKTGFEADGAYFTYPAENFTAFDIADDGTLYTAEGEQESTIFAYDLTGKRSETGKVGAKADAIACREDKLICAYLTREGAELVSLDPQTNEKEALCVIESVYDILNMETDGDSVYLLGRDISRENVEGVYYDQFGSYSYNAEKLFKVSVSGGEITESGVEFPQAFSAEGGEVLVYAADEDGYYFTDFDNKNKSRNDLGNLTAFELYDKGKFILSSDEIPFKLNSGTTAHEDGMVEILDNVIIPKANSIRCEGGYCFVCDLYIQESGSGVIGRFKLDEYVKPNQKIRFISTKYSVYEPFGCGFVIEQNELDAETFALTVLSLDPNYDMCIINSVQGHAANIRSKGSFYPLNEVEGVSEYLEKCFPYVKEAAYTDNGEIWMLPVVLNAGAVEYIPENCEKAGIAFTDDMSYEDFIGQCKAAYESDLADGYSAHCRQLTDYMLLSYLSENDSFDAPLFRETAEYFKENANAAKFPEYLPSFSNAANGVHWSGADSGFLFAYATESLIHRSFADLDFVRAAPAPHFKSGDKNVVTCAFITVNPNSSNLEATLDYISELARYLSEQKNSLILADRTLYSDTDYMRDLYGIYENGRLCFNVSSEIVFDDFLRYCAGEIDLDSLIAEADRKYEMYLKE